MINANFVSISNFFPYSDLCKQLQFRCLFKIKQGQQVHRSSAFHSSDHHNWLHYQIIGSKTEKNVQIDQQTAEIWPTELFVVREGVSE